MAKANRSDADEAAVISKDITPTLNAAKRQITGAGDTEGEVVFYIRSADKPYYYGIRVLLSTGLVDTIEWGTLTFKYAIVQATS